MTTSMVRTRNTKYNLKLLQTESCTLKLISAQKQDKCAGTSLKRLSFAACFPVYVEDTLTARTSVIGILEKVDEERNQAASQKQSVKQRLLLCPGLKLKNLTDETPLTRRAQRQNS